MKEIFTENSFYYFFSTVPQVLAGSIALVGAFLIFFISESNKKMLKILKDTNIYIKQLVDSHLIEIRKRIGDEYLNRLDEIEYVEKRHWYELFRRIVDCFKGEDHVILRNYFQFESEFDFKSNVINRGIRAVVLSGTLMAISIFIIPFVQYLIKLLPLGIVITVLIIIFSCYAIYLIADVVIQAIQKL